MNETDRRKRSLADSRRIVVKCGTSSLTDESGRLDRGMVETLCDQVGRIMDSGRTVTMVASGAIGAGMGELDLSERPGTLPVLQAVAAVGQGQLMRAFHDTMERYGRRVGQVLVDRADFEHRGRYLNIRNTLFALHERQILPIVNENDAVSVDEIRFGDNDIIAAHVTNMLAAELLIILTTVEGVMDGERIVSAIDNIDEARGYVNHEKSRFGSGGMATKLTAVEMVTTAGEAAIIASAKKDDTLIRILDGENIGTFFTPSRSRLSSKRRWIGQAARSTGTIVIDGGAADALTARGKSLLPSGITDIAGEFTAGDIITVTGPDGTEIARGLSNYDSTQLRMIMGKRSGEILGILGDKPYDEAVHRNNMTLI